VPDELDEAGECLLADVDDVVGGHMELVTGQLERVGQRDVCIMSLACWPI